MTKPTGSPDVSVIVPVFNTMPYLTACLESLVNQTLGAGRLEVVAIDDGSTDGSAAELDRFARDHPQMFVVRHQRNSGGPANPCNRGLELATGRYVFFLGSDDYLGEDAMRRLVSKADEWGSDVIFGRMEGINGRNFDRRIYARTEPDLDLTKHPLPYALSNTKMFRRALIEEHKISYPEGLRLGSDQPFVVSALVRARRISVLSDYTYYYAVKRLDATNITYSSTWRTRLNDISAVIHQIAAVVPPGEIRDQILRRHFHLELGKLLRLDLPQLSSAEQQELVTGFAQLADQYLTDRVSDLLRASQRVRLRLAQQHDVDTLLEVLAVQEATREPPLALRGERAYVSLPGFGVAPLDWYELKNEGVRERLVRGIVISDAILDGLVVKLSGSAALTADSQDQLHLALVPVAGTRQVPPARRLRPDQVIAERQNPVLLHRGPAGSAVGLQAEARLTPATLAHREMARWSVRVRVRVGAWVYDLPVRAPVAPAQATTSRRHGGDRLELRTEGEVLTLVQQAGPRLADLRPTASRAVRRLARGAARRTSASLKARVPPALTAWARRRVSPREPSRTPLLSVVLSVEGAEEYLPSCLDSVLSQTLTELEVLVVDQSSTDRGWSGRITQIIDAYARRDPRIEIIRRPNARPGSARRQAVEQARGRFLHFVNSSDVVPRDALRFMVNRLTVSGSDFCLGAVRRMQNGRLSPPSWHADVHGRERRAVTIETFPAAIKDVMTGNRMFRTEFWRRRMAEFSAGPSHPEHLPMVMAYVRATAFDVLSKVTSYNRIGEQHTSMAHRQPTLLDLRDRVDALDETWRLLQVEASPGVCAAWRGRVLDRDLALLMDGALTASPDYRELLGDACARYLTMADEDGLGEVSFRHRVYAACASTRSWDQLEDAQQLFRVNGAVPPTAVHGSDVLAAEQVIVELGLELPRAIRRLGSAETTQASCLSRAAWLDDRTLLLRGWSFIRSVDLTNRNQVTEARWVNLTTGDTVAIDVEPYATTQATRWAAQRHANVDRSGFQLTCDLTRLTRSGRDHRWQLRLRTRLLGPGDDGHPAELTREDAVHAAVAGSSAAQGNLTAGRLGEDGPQVIPRFDAEHGFVLWLCPAEVGATGLGTAAESGDRQAAATVHGVTVDGDAIVIEVSMGTETADREVMLHLVSESRTVAGRRLAQVAEGTASWSFDGRVSEFELPARPLPPGHYALELTDGHGAGRHLPVSERTRSALGTELRTTQHLVLLGATTGKVWLRFDAPLADQERGRWAQTQLVRSYRDRRSEASDAVLFQCCRGESATDSQRALHDVLAVERPDTDLYWGVSDYSTWLPAGAVPLLIGSAEWYDLLGSARYLCPNIDFDPFFTKRPFQKYLQTFHGYPFKSMGRTYWHGRGWSDQRIAAECERRNREWDAIVVPSTDAGQYYRQEYGYRGQVLVTGYPRCDVLTSAEAPRLRDTVRRNLGIQPDQTVLLWAPTYRDQLTTRGFAATRYAGLDVTALSKRLGPSYIIWVRGHNNNQREPERLPGHRQIVDITDYPEINDLTLAADVAVLDYSSLRFDWALTGKPMIFFVPDLENYFATRPPLFDFVPSAPGPLLTTTDQVADAVADLDQVRSTYAAQMKLFNATFNALHDGQATRRVVDAFFSD